MVMIFATRSCLGSSRLWVIYSDEYNVHIMEHNIMEVEYDEDEVKPLADSLCLGKS